MRAVTVCMYSCMYDTGQVQSSDLKCEARGGQRARGAEGKKSWKSWCGDESGTATVVQWCSNPVACRSNTVVAIPS